MEQVAGRTAAGWWIPRRAHQVTRFARMQPLGAAGLAVCIVVIVAALFAPWVGRYDPNIDNYLVALAPPSSTHWFGTDSSGRDLYSRIVYGSRISLYVALLSIVMGVGGGYLLGLVSGYFGGKADLVLQRFIDAKLAIPSILLALVMVAVLGPGLDKVIAAISISFIGRAARVSRGVVLSLKENVYVDAARVVGASHLRIMFAHILPNALAPALILASISLGQAVLLEASLSFLGLGVPPPHASWGRMLSGSAIEMGTVAPWLMIFPGAAIGFLVLAFNLFGDALRDVWDPKLRGR